MATKVATGARRASHWAILVPLSFWSLSYDGFWDIPVASITVRPPTSSVLTGFTQQFTVSATYVDGSTGVLKSPV